MKADICSTVDPVSLKYYFKKNVTCTPPQASAVTLFLFRNPIRPMGEAYCLVYFKCLYQGGGGGGWNHVKVQKKRTCKM